MLPYRIQVGYMLTMKQPQQVSFVSVEAYMSRYFIVKVVLSRRATLIPHDRIRSTRISLRPVRLNDVIFILCNPVLLRHCEKHLGCKQTALQTLLDYIQYISTPSSLTRQSLLRDEGVVSTCRTILIRRCCTLLRNIAKVTYSFNFHTSSKFSYQIKLLPLPRSPGNDRIRICCSENCQPLFWAS